MIRLHTEMRSFRKNLRQSGSDGSLMTGRDWEEECGVFGVFDTTRSMKDAARIAYFGLFALQHRGQESAGIAVHQDGKIICHKNKGLVVEVFETAALQTLGGQAAIGHVRYPSSGETGYESIQPVMMESGLGSLALVQNGAIINATELREELKQTGSIFQTNSDFEVILALLARNRILTGSLEQAIHRMLAEIRGAYSMIFLSTDQMIGIRDPLGIRPLILGKKDNSYVLASESCALDAVGAEVVRDILPGEIVYISEKEVRSEYFVEPRRAAREGKICIFEFVYFARPDSVMDGASIYESRWNAGVILAREAPCDADLVVDAPDSGIAAAMGYAQESNIPYGAALLKNRYVGRTFIQPTEVQREMSTSLKFSVLKSAVQGKRILMVDDSIVRGMTTRHNVRLLREAGAKEVHIRVASPPVCFPCFYGINTPEQKELTAGLCPVEDIKTQIGADSLAYISLDGLKSSTTGIRLGHCTSCFNGDYPAGMPVRIDKQIHRIQW